MSAERLESAGAALRDGRYQDAEELLLDALAERPAEPKATLYLGIALGRQNRLDEAEAVLRRACELAPIDALPWYNLGRIHQLAGRAESAADCFRQALRRDPLHEPSSQRLREVAADPGAGAGLPTPDRDQCLRSVDVASVLKLGLAFGLVYGLVALLVSAVVAGIYEETEALLAGVGIGMMAFISLILSSLIAAVAYNVVAHWLGPVGLELVPVGRMLSIREVDPYASARINAAQAVAQALLSSLVTVPFYLLMMASAAAFGGGGGAAAGMAGMLGVHLLQQVLIVGCVFVGAVLQTQVYNWACLRCGGMVFEHRYTQRQSELVRFAVWRTSLTLALCTATFLLPPAVLLALGTVVEAPRWGLGLLGAAALIVVVLPFGHVLCYNLVATRFGGLLVEFQAE